MEHSYFPLVSSFIHYSLARTCTITPCKGHVLYMKGQLYIQSIKIARVTYVCLCLLPGTNSIMAQFDGLNPYHWPGWFIVALALFYIGIALVVFREIRPPPKLKRPKVSVSCHCLTRIKLSTQLQSDWKMQFTVSSIYTCSLDALPLLSFMYVYIYICQYVIA